MSYNKVKYECKCGRCHECKSREKAKSIYKAPKGVREQWFQKKASEEQALLDGGEYMLVNCPKCHRNRMVLSESLKLSFSCDKCGFRV